MLRDAMVPPNRQNAKRPLVHSRTAVACAMVAFGVVMTGCARDGAAKEKAPAELAAAEDFPPVLATIGNEPITMTEVRARAGDNLARIETQYRLLRSTIVQLALDSMLHERVIVAEATKRGMTTDELIAAEGGASMTPTDVEIAAWYNNNPDRTGGRALADIKVQIADFLRSERKATAFDRLKARLNKEKNVAVNFEPYRLTFENGSSPSLGKEGAPVTLVEFSDFQCPFCNRFAPTLKQIEKKYGDKVHVVYRQYPIPSIHPNAFKAAEASLCANDQGKFWEMHDVMFAEQAKLGVADLKEKAVRLGMDKKKFDTCIDTGRYVEQVQKDMKDGEQIGVTGTPAVFINGVELKGGAVAFNVVTAAIDKELARAGKTN